MVTCPWEPAQYLIFSSNVPPLLFYSHLTAVLAATIFCLALIPRAKESLAIRLFVVMVLFFIAWTLIDLPLWAMNQPDISLFLWSVQVLVEICVYVLAFYFAHTFVFKKDLSPLLKIGLLALLLPILLFLPTNFLFPGVDASTCVVTESSFVVWYTYASEIVLSFLILFTCFRGVHRQVERKMELWMFTIGILFFLIAFASGNLVGSITENWDLAQVGLFGMPVFIGFLAYAIVKYHAFNVKMAATQALVIGTALLIGARLFYSSTTTGLILSASTLAMFMVSGVFLVRSVKREIEQREKIETLAKDLAATNERQEGLIHFISHEVKGFLTKDMGAFASLAEGDFGPLPEPMKPFVAAALAQSRDGAQSVKDILKASNIKKGTITYKSEPFDLKALVEEVVAKAKPLAERKQLALSFVSDSSGPYTITGDKAEMGDHVLHNLIDNAVNYTLKGSISVSLKKVGSTIVFAVSDTGVGLSDEDKARLFTEGGHGKESQKINVHSTGYGLYIAKNIVLQHKGTIRAESAGPGKGSTFVVELPA